MITQKKTSDVEEDRLQQLKNYEKAFSFFYQSYNYIFLIPFSYFSSDSSSDKNILWLLNFIFTLLISYICCLNIYEHAYATKNQISKRYSYFTYLIASVEILNAVFNSVLNFKIIVYVNIVMNFVTILDIFYELPYYTQILQKINMYCCIFNFLTSLLFALSIYIDISRDISLLLCLICIVPISIKIGNLLYRSLINQAEYLLLQSIENPEFEYRNPNFIDIYLRKLYEKTQFNFKFSHFFKDPETCLTLSALISSEFTEDNIGDEKEDYIGLSRQTFIILEFFRDLYKQILKARQKIDKKANIKYCYMSFLIQVYKKRTIAYLEILNEKNDQTRQKSLREKQSLYSILQQAEESFKYEAFMNDHINVLQIIDYDRELKNNQVLLEECIKNKKLLLNDMSNNIMDLNLFFKKAKQLIQQRKILKAKLHQSCAINDENINLKEQIQSYIYFLSMGDVKLKNFYFKSSQNNSKQANIQQNAGQNQTAPKIQMYRSERFSIVFITLVKNIGTITGASNNLGTLFDYENHEMVGKNINIIIPSNISTKHQQILNNFSKRGSNNHCFQNFRFILGQNKKGFIIPLMLKLKIDIVGKDDFGISGIFRRVSEKQNFMMISETFNISGISENIYKEVFSQYFTLSEVQQFNVNKLIPLFLGTVTIKNEEDEAYSNSQEEIFESFLILNYSKQAHQTLLQKTYSIESDIQQIQLSTSNIYKIVFSLQSHFSYGFRYYNLIINSFSKIKQISEEYASACSTLVQQLDEIYQTPRQILLNLMDQCLNLKYDDEVSIEKMISNKLAEQNSVFLPLDESKQIQINQMPSKKEIEDNFNPFNKIQQQSLNNISDDQNDQKPDNNFQIPQINHCESFKQIQTNNKDDNNNGVQNHNKNKIITSNQQEQNYVKNASKQLNLRKQKKNLTFADNFTNNYVLKRKKSNNTINEEPIEEQESFVQTTKSNKTSGTQSKSQTSQSQVLQKIQETKIALEQNDIQQQQMYQSAGNKRLQQFAQKLKFSLQNSKNKQSPKLKKSPLSPEKVIQILQLNQKSNSSEFQSPLQNQKHIQFQRKKERKGLIRLLTSRMQDKENVVSESDSSGKSSRNKTKKNTTIDPGAELHQRHSLHKHTFVSIQKKSSSEIDQISPYSSSPLSSFRQGKQRTIMLKSLQNLLQQQFQNIQKQEDDNEENGQASNSQEDLKFSQKDLDIKQIPLTSDRDNSQKNFAVFEKEDMLKGYRNNFNSEQEINKVVDNTRIKIKIGTNIQQSEKSYKDDMIKSKMSSLDFLKNSKIESGTKISKKGSTLMISKNTEKNHMSKYSFEKVQEMQSKNTKFDVYDYDFSSSSSESSGSLKNQNHNNETSKLIQQQQTHNFQTNQAILDSRQDIKNPLQTANNIISGSNIPGNIGQFNSAQVIERLKKDLKYSNETKQQHQKKKKNKMEIKQNIDDDEETSSQSEQKKRNLIFQKLIMHQINKYQKDLIIYAIKILGFLVLLGIALGTFIIYLDINNQFGKMKKNIDYLGWPMSVKSQIILVLKGEVLLRYLKNNIFNYEQKEIDYYSSIAEQQLKSNYELLQNLIADQLGKDINQYLIFRDIVNTQVEYTFQNSFSTLPYQHNTTMFLQYNLDFINSFLFRISNLLPDRENDESNIFLNYLQSIDALDIINSNSIDNENDIKQYLDFQLYFGLFAMITISLFFAISVFPLYAIISSYSQKVLKIFSTFSQDLLTQMHTHLNQFSKQIKKNKKLLTHHQQQNILLFETIRIEKKRNISETTDLPKLKIFHILFSISCFLMIIIYPLLNFFLCQAFVNEQHQNLNLLQILFYTKSLSIENIELNYLISYKKIMPNEYISLNLTQFEMRGNQLIEKNTKDIDELQIIVKQQHQFMRRNQQEFINFVLAILEGNACNVIDQNSQYFDSQSQLTNRNCLQIRNGIFTRGLLLSISDTFDIMPVVTSLYKITDPNLYKQMLNAYQKTTSLVDLDNYNVGLSIFIDACKNFILDISQSYFSYMYAVQLALICYQIVLLLLIFYFGWSYFCSNLQNQLYSSNYMIKRKETQLQLRKLIICHVLCLTCISSDQYSCTSCDSSKNLIQSGSPSPFQCICQQSYYLDSTNSCSKCDLSCKSCNGVTNQNCTQCESSRTLSNGMCLCNSSFYDNGLGQCLPCIVNCINCSSTYPLQCLQCAQNRVFQNSSCQCVEGYYENNNTCLQCNNLCQICKLSKNSSCDQCLPNSTLQNSQCVCNQGYFYNNSNRQVINGICSCINGFYEDSQSLICQTCQYSCSQCTNGTANDCIACSANRQLKGGLCVCNDGYFDNPVLQNCSQCDYSCATCSNSSKNNCLTCQTYRNKQSDGSCQCIPGYFDDSISQLCKQCHYSCFTCTNSLQTGCLNCQANRSKQIDGSCLCNPGFYDNTISQQCQLCHYSCQTCYSGSSSNCLTCKLNSTLQGNSCVCNQGFYDDSIQMSCVACHYSCLTCQNNSSNGCLTCKQDRLFQSGTCLCYPGQYDDTQSKKCLPCNYTCQTCNGDSTNSCTSCNSIRYLTNNAQGSCLCNQSYYELAQNSLCQLCNKSCLTCIGPSPTMCTQCDSSKNFIPSIPSASQYSCICISNSFYDSQNITCILCNYRCTTCYGALQTQCLTCSPSLNRELQGSSCVCMQGYFENAQGQCQPCHSSCFNCVGPTKFQCFQCDSSQNRFYNQNYSTCDCGQGFYDILQPFQSGKLAVQTCLKCNSLCSQCIQNNLCLTCINNLILLPNLQCSCPQGSYLDSNSNFCLACYYTCQSCIGPGQQDCLSCKQNMISTPSYTSTVSPFNMLYKCTCQEQNCIKCHYSCQLNSCSTDEPNICLDCLPNRQITQKIIQGKNASICICNDGFYEDEISLQCKPCNQSCATCLGPSESDCLSCNKNRQIYLQNSQIYGRCLCSNDYFENQQTQQCQKCNTSCSSCQGNTNFCTACKENAFLNSLGICTCLPRYYLSLEGDCLKCHYSCSNCLGGTEYDCLECSSKTRTLIQIQQSQLKFTCFCNQGYFDSGADDCQICSPLCMTCIQSANICLKCYPEELSKRILVNNLCVCKVGYKENQNGVCVQCPYDCSMCDSSGNCIQCSNSQRALNPLTKRCPCKEGYYEASDVSCQKCSYRCKNCIQNANLCSECDQNSYLNSHQNCMCNDGFYEVQPTQDQIKNIPENQFQMCEKCHYKCNTCVNPNTCTSCLLSNSNVYYNLDTQLCECYFGYEMIVDLQANTFSCLQLDNLTLQITKYLSIQHLMISILEILMYIFNIILIFSLIFGSFLVSELGLQTCFDIQLILYYNGMKLNLITDFLEVIDKKSIFKGLNYINPFQNVIQEENFLSVYQKSYNISTNIYKLCGGGLLLWKIASNKYIVLQISKLKKFDSSEV
ncbi:hypothetical protein ABPG73_005093 [Tetrahymena malaccensis]